MTKNPILNDLIGLCIFIPVILLLHVSDPSDGLGLWSSLAFVPLFVVALDVMVQFQFMAIDKPKLSFEWIMNAVSWGVLQASVMTINMADFPDRAAVLLQFAIQFTIMTSVWWFFGAARHSQDKHIAKQTRFATRQEFDTYRDGHSFRRSEILGAAGMTCISIASMIWGNVVLGLVFLLTVPVILSQGIQMHHVPHWYSWVRSAVYGLAAGAVVYLSMSGF